MKFDEKKLKEVADKCFFDKVEGLNFMLATEDGNFFYPQSVSACLSHSKGGKIFVLQRGKKPVVKDANGFTFEANEEPKKEGLNASDTVELIKDISTMEELKSIKKELGEEIRKTVLKALEEKEQELKK